MSAQNSFAYRNGSLHAEDVSLVELAAHVGTPFYCYSSHAIEAAFKEFLGALVGLDAGVFYALKANSNQAVIATLARLGAGADVVSEGEMRRALAAGIPPGKIIFAGVGKSSAELTAALEAGILQFNVESLPELRRLSALATERGIRAPVALRINPDVDAGTLDGIATGSADKKFGIDIADARAIAKNAAEFAGVDFTGLAVHIGSLLTDLDPCRQAFERVTALYRDLRDRGLPLRRLDLGGGLGIRYRDEQVPSLSAYAEMVRDVTKGLDAELAFEPGRRIVGNAGVLVARVEYVKQGRGKQFLVVDAAMNDLIRPMLYEAWHEILPLNEAPAGSAPVTVDVVGPICESTDIFAHARSLPPLNEGDFIAICSSGAYSAVMASSYNSRPLVPEVMVRGGNFAVVRERPSYESMIAMDTMPPWLD
jgi:diaminopimelate decarboxylase